MDSPERRLGLRLEQQALPEGQRISVAFHPYFSTYYHEMYRSLIHLLRFDRGVEELGGKSFPIGFTKLHTDGSPFYAALEKEGLFKSNCVVAPAWFAPPLPDSMFHLAEMSDAFTQSSRVESGEEVLTSRFIVLFPYAELRQDDNSPEYLRTYWPEEAREAVSARIFANTIISNGVTEVIFFEPHSEKALRYFQDIETLCLTAAPIFAAWLREHNLIDEKTAVVALDMGAAQRCKHLADLLTKWTGIEIEVVVLGKERSGHSEVGEQNLLLGDPKGKRAILFDDSVASAGSILKTASSLVNYGCREVVPCIAHGILCGKYVENINQARTLGIIPCFAITNSLPQAGDIEFMPIGLDVLPVEEMLAFFARQVAISSIPEVKTNPLWQDFILTPAPKEAFFARLAGRRYP